MNEQQQFTVFANDGFQNNYAGVFRGLGLHALLDRSAREFGGCTWVSWAQEWPIGYDDGTKPWEVLRAESIAAGRIIKQIDGKWVAFGAEPEPIKIDTDALAAYIDDQNRAMRRMLDLMPIASKTPTLDNLANTTEPLRNPLPSLNAGPFDAFPGFSVQSETHPDEPTPVHALQRLAEGDPRCGSALLLG